MFATESHAKENWWCPNAVVPVSTDILQMRDDPLQESGGEKVRLVAAANRTPRTPSTIPDHCKCLGTGCAYWRWRDLKQDRGYCGKAGRPFD